MQTFLPLESFSQSASVLDRARLGKQRVENLQIMMALTLPTYGWQSHPAVGLWRGYECALLEYQNAICDEWEARGYRDTCREKTEDVHLAVCRLSDSAGPPQLPPWYGNAAFHLSHRSNLVRKDAVRYGALWPDVPADLPYVWPAA